MNDPGEADCMVWCPCKQVVGSSDVTSLAPYVIGEITLGTSLRKLCILQINRYFQQNDFSFSLDFSIYLFTQEKREN